MVCRNILSRFKAHLVGRVVVAIAVTVTVVGVAASRYRGVDLAHVYNILFVVIAATLRLLLLCFTLGSLASLSRLHSNIHRKLLQASFQSRRLVVRFKAGGGAVKGLLQTLGHLGQLIQPFLRGVRFSLQVEVCFSVGEESRGGDNFR